MSPIYFIMWNQLIVITKIQNVSWNFYWSFNKMKFQQSLLNGLRDTLYFFLLSGTCNTPLEERINNRKFETVFEISNTLLDDLRTFKSFPNHFLVCISITVQWLYVSTMILIPHRITNINWHNGLYWSEMLISV